MALCLVGRMLGRGWSNAIWRAAGQYWAGDESMKRLVMIMTRMKKMVMKEMIKLRISSSGWSNTFWKNAGTVTDDSYYVVIKMME